MFLIHLTYRVLLKERTYTDMSNNAPEVSKYYEGTRDR